MIVSIIISILFINQNQLRLLTSIFIIILFGIFKSNLDFTTPVNSIKHFKDTGKKNTAELVGIIKEFPDYDTNKIRFVIESEELLTSDEKFFVNGDVTVTLREDIFGPSGALQPVLNAGDRVVLNGKLLDPASARNPGEFNYKKYLEIHSVHKTFISTGYKNVKIIDREKKDFLYQNIIFPAKKYALANIDKYLSGDEAAYLKGLVTGDRNDISSETKEAFINAGVMHLIAVSGLNVAYIIIFVTLILSIFRIPFTLRTILTIVILIFYCLFTGSPASIVRATIMGILFLLSGLIERKVNFYNTIGIAAMIILIYDSKQLFDAGFILSFSAVISMVFIFTSFEKLFMSRIINTRFRGKKIVAGIAILFFTTLAAQLGTLPVTVNYFGKISIISLLANIVVVPFANLSLAIGFFQILTSLFSEYLSSVIAETNYIILFSQLYFIDMCGSFKFAYVNSPDFSFANISAYYIIIILLVTIKSKAAAAFRVILSILVFLTAGVINLDLKQNLKITFIDVGQGDCALIQTPGNKTILVDCGILTFTYNSGQRTIAPYLRRNGIDKIDLLIITHLHNDHIGGINFLLENFKIGKILESGQTYKSSFINKMDSLTEAKGVIRETVRAGDMIDILENIRLYFLFPDNQFVDSNGKTKDNNLNNGSVAFILKYREQKFLFTGDIEKEGERFLYDTFSDFLKSDVLKVAHHGSITSTTIPFIVKNRPSTSVISCGMFNKFNHPSDIVLSRLQGLGSKIYRTDLNGAVILESDGFSITNVDWR